MGFACKIGFHQWSGCKCTKCGKVRDDDHDWSKDCGRCARCGKERAINHHWNGCTCSLCHKSRDKEHQWSGCLCTSCGAERFTWGAKNVDCQQCTKDYNAILANRTLLGNSTISSKWQRYRPIIYITSDCNIFDIAANSTLAFVADSRKGLHILATDLLSGIDLLAVPKLRGMPHTVEICNNIAYIGVGYHQPITDTKTPDDEICMMDITHAPCVTSDRYYRISGRIKSMAASGSLVAVVTRQGGFYVWKSDARRLKLSPLLENYLPKGLSAWHNLNYFSDVAISGSRTYLVGKGGVFIGEFQSGQFCIVGKWEEDSWGHAIALYGNYILVGTYGNMLLILNAGDMDNIIRVGEYRYNETVLSILIRGTFAYLLCTDEVVVIDISTPENPKKIAWYDLSLYQIKDHSACIMRDSLLITTPDIGIDIYGINSNGELQRRNILRAKLVS